MLLLGEAEEREGVLQVRCSKMNQPFFCRVPSCCHWTKCLGLMWAMRLRGVIMLALATPSLSTATNSCKNVWFIVSLTHSHLTLPPPPNFVPFPTFPLLVCCGEGPFPVDSGVKMVVIHLATLNASCAAGACCVFDALSKLVGPFI